MKKNVDLLLPLRHVHGWIHEKKAVIWLPIKGYFKSKYSNSKKVNEDYYPIDFVITWVDGNDPVWREKKAKYSGQTFNKDGEERYRDWGVFKYWFRSVEKYAPWVNRIFLITDGQVPDFLITNHPKLTIIDHKEILPNEGLPVFNSCAIESGIHKIKGLCEHFVYFNDDVYITRPLTPDDFFCNGLPKYIARGADFHPGREKSLFSYQLVTLFGLINSEYNIREAIERFPEKWFPYYADNKKPNSVLYKRNYIQNFWFSHLGVPYRKSAWLHAEDIFSEEFKETSMHRFRNPFDVIHYIVIMCEIMEGNFFPVKKEYYGSLFFSDNTQMLKDILKDAEKGKFRMICINDNEYLSKEDFLFCKGMLMDYFDRLLPDKSSFENEI